MKKNRKHSFVAGGLIAALVLLGFGFLPGSPEVWAQGRIREARPSVPSVTTEGRISRQTFGTASQVSHTLQAFAFAPLSSALDNVMEANPQFASRFCTASCFLDAPLLLPSGALLTEIELEACDTDGVVGNDVTATLVVVGSLESSAVDTATAATAGAPGCTFISALLTTPITINNVANSYFVEVTLDGATVATRFQAVRVFYNLQVSPAPAVATFADVPITHPFSRFVEALAGSGITGGCIPGFYCPDLPVTRGQMAVFLSTALGLHFPN